MSCQRCNSKRILSAQGKCNDLCCLDIGKKEYVGYVPQGLNIGDGDEMFFNVCLDCGQMQGQYPIPTHSLEK